MKLTHSIKNSAGIGLIEVLITTVVVAVGLLAVASLQGDLLSGSRGNKTRAEAQALANTKIEQLRDTIQKAGTTGYNALASSAANESIGGITETFTRSWTVLYLPLSRSYRTSALKSQCYRVLVGWLSRSHRQHTKPGHRSERDCV